MGRSRHRGRGGARGRKPNADELISLVKPGKGAAHAPKQIQLVKELPMSSAGKKVFKGGFWASRERVMG